MGARHGCGAGQYVIAPHKVFDFPGTPSFPLVGNRLENKERFRTSRNDKITNPQS